MQEKHLYEYAVIRVVPRIERDEFINVGIILFSKRKKYLKLVYKLDAGKLQTLYADIDLDMVDKCLESWSKMSEGKKDGGEIATLDVAERFRWITAVKSATIQTSRPHPGFSDDLDRTFQCLFEDIVL